MSRFPYLKERLTEIPINYVNNVYLESPSGQFLEHNSESPLYLMIRRYEFDNFLVNLAKDHVDIAEGEMVNKIEVLESHVEVHISKGQTYKCKMIIGADGANSVVARQTGL